MRSQIFGRNKNLKLGNKQNYNIFPEGRIDFKTNV